MLRLFVIYERPPENPNGYVVREWWKGDVIKETKVFRVATLEEARKLIPSGFYRMCRDPLDDPTIVEIWV